MASTGLTPSAVHSRERGVDTATAPTGFWAKLAGVLLPWRLVGAIFRGGAGGFGRTLERFARWSQNLAVNTWWMDHPWFRRRLLQNATSAPPYVRMKRKGCAQLVTLYGGIDAFVGNGGYISGLSPLDFFQRSGLFGRNLLWLRDPYGDNFARGISDEIPSAEALAEWTREYIRSLPHVREVHAIGYSSGSYAAVMFGHLCKMQSVWAFSPRTSHTKGHDEAIGRLAALLSTHNGVTRYHLLYGADNALDALCASQLAHLPGVTLHPFEGTSDHYLIRSLTESGELRTILPPYLPAMAQPTTEEATEGAALIR